MHAAASPLLGAAFSRTHGCTQYLSARLLVEIQHAQGGDYANQPS